MPVVENEKPEEETLPQEEETQQPQEEQVLAMVVAETEGSKKLLSVCNFVPSQNPS